MTPRRCDDVPQHAWRTVGARLDRGDSDFDIRHSFTTGVTYFLPSPSSRGVVQAVARDWSLDALVLARSAPPVDVVGPVNFTASAAMRSRPNVNPGVPLEIYGDQYPGGKILNRRPSRPCLPGSRATSGATCCVASVRRRPISRCSGNFASPNASRSVSGPSASTSSTRRTSVARCSI